MTEVPILTELLQGGHAPTLFLAAAIVATFLVGIAATLGYFGQWLATRRSRALLRQPIPIDPYRRRQLSALATGRDGRS
jgi:hypothetical protein